MKLLPDKPLGAETEFERPICGSRVPDPGERIAGSLPSLLAILALNELCSCKPAGRQAYRYQAGRLAVQLLVQQVCICDLRWSV